MSPELQDVFKDYDLFIANTLSVVNSMNSTFEKKRNSVAQQRRSNKKTGLIDASRLSEYKFAEDLFKKRTLVSNQKSHSVYVLLDWSGSVTGSILPMAKQAINLARFCRKAKIHFRVCAFTSGASAIRNDMNIVKQRNMNVHDAKEKPLSMHGDVDLLEFVSSDTPRADFDTACKYLYLLAYLNSPKNKKSIGYNSSMKVPETYDILRGFALNGTPLNASLLNIKNIIDADTQNKKIQNPNLIVITDGMSESISLSTQSGSYSNDNDAFDNRSTSIFLDPKTNKQYKSEDYKKVYNDLTASYKSICTTSLLIDWIRDSGVSCFQMYLENASPAKMLKTFIPSHQWYDYSFKNIDLSVNSLKRKVDSRQVGCLTNFMSYDKAFFINPATAFGEEMENSYSYLDENDDEEESNMLGIDLDNAKTAKQIGKAFSSAMSSVSNQKLVGDLLVTEICENV